MTGRQTARCGRLLLLHVRPDPAFTLLATAEGGVLEHSEGRGVQRDAEWAWHC